MLTFVINFKFAENGNSYTLMLYFWSFYDGQAGLLFYF